MLPLLLQEVTVRRHWISEEAVIDLYAVAQCAPGIIMVNTAVYVGYITAGVPGSLVAVLGEITSPMILMILIATLFQRIMDFAMFQHFLAGVGAMVCVLLVNTVWTMGKKCLKDIFTVTVCIAAFLLGMLFHAPSIVLTLGAGTVSILYALLSGRWRS